MEDYLLSNSRHRFFILSTKKKMNIKRIKKIIAQVSKMVFNLSFLSVVFIVKYLFILPIYKSEVWKKIFHFYIYFLYMFISNTYKMCYNHILHNDIYQNQRRNNNKVFFNIDVKLVIQNSLVFSILQQSTSIVNGYLDLRSTFN